MKQKFPIIGLSLLSISSAFAQEPLQQNIAENVPAVQEQDAQTIFFSEDFIDELTNDTLPVFAEDNIPLEKNAPNDDVSKNQTSIESEKTPIQKTLPEAVKPAPVETKQNEAKTSEDINLQTQKTDNAVIETQKPVKTIEKNLPLEKQEPSIPNNQENISKTEPAIQTPEAKKFEDTTQETVNTPSQEEQSNLTQKIQEMQEQQKMQQSAPSILHQAPAPVLKKQPKAKPKKNAFSLDAPTSLPQSILQNDTLSVNIMDKGIKISPEQRAKMMMKKKYNEMDLNHDGIVSKNEFIKFKTDEAHKISVQVFNQIDENQDGIISDAEYEILMQKMIDNYVTPKK